MLVITKTVWYNMTLNQATLIKKLDTFKQSFLIIAHIFPRILKILIKCHIYKMSNIKYKKKLIYLRLIVHCFGELK